MKAEVAIIGGSGLEGLFEDKGQRIKIRTAYGDVESVVGEVDGLPLIFLPRHGFGHVYPPHRVPYLANILAVKYLGAKWVIGISAVGSLKLRIKPGMIVVPNDLIDYTKTRKYTFYDDIVVHVDFSKPYCEKLNKIIFSECRRLKIRARLGGTYVCFEGPRFETPAEIRMFRLLGADIVGMTNAPEASLARELAMHYSLIAIVTNYAAGIQKRVTQEEVYEIMSKVKDRILNLLPKVVSKVYNIIDFRDYCVEYEEYAKEILRRMIR